MTRTVTSRSIAYEGARPKCEPGDECHDASAERDDREPIRGAIGERLRA